MPGMFDSGQPFSAQLNDMLAPYQSAVQRLQQPYPMLGGSGGSLGQNHPLLAGALNAGLESAAFVPGPSGPEGVGGGISRALQGVLGASQFERQRMLQSAMLPYQMLQPRLTAMDTMAQIAERQSEVPYRHAMEERAMAQSDLYNARVGALSNPKSIQGLKTDDKGQDWQEIFSPETGRSRLFNPSQQKFADELPQEQQPSFQSEVNRRKSMQANADYSLEGILRRRAAGDPSAETDYNRYLSAQGAIAGGRAGAVKGADQPYVDEAAMVARENKNKYDDLPPNPKNTEAEKFANIPGMENDPDVRAYNQKKQDYQRTVSQRDQEFEHYASSTAPGQGVTRAEYSANKDKYPPKNGKRGDLPSGDNRPTASDSGTAWTPKK